MNSVLVDTGFFFALFNERDKNHSIARHLEKHLEHSVIILPWPIMYETVNTRLTKQSANLAKFITISQLSRTNLLDDSPYRKELLSTVLAQHAKGARLSLVDAVLSRIIEDVNVPISAMLTFNKRDFLWRCHSHNVEFLDGK